MKKLIKKIVLIIVLILCCIGINSTVKAYGSWSTECTNSNHKNCRVVTFRRFRANSSGSYEYRVHMKRDITRSMPISSLKDGLCIEHDVSIADEGDIDDTDEEGNEVKNYLILRGTIQNGQISLYRYLGNGNVRTLADNMESAVALKYAYIMSRNETYVSNSHWGSMRQFAFWSTEANGGSGPFTKEFFNEIADDYADEAGLSSSERKNNSNYKFLVGLGSETGTHGLDEYDGNRKSPKNLNSQATSYMNQMKKYQEIKNQRTTNASVVATDSTGMIIGPFKVKYSSITWDGDQIAGLDYNQFQLKDTNGNVINRNSWQFGTYSSNTFTQTQKITSNSNFYIRVNNGVTGIPKTLVITEKKLEVEAEFFVLDNPAQKQKQIFTPYARRYEKTTSLELPIEEPVGNLQIIKTGRNGARLEGVSFRITGPNGYNTVQKTNSNGVISLTNLLIGNYTITETGIDNSSNPGDKNYGYVVDNSITKTVAVRLKQTTQESFSNRYRLATSLTINKKDKASGIAMANVGFTLRMTSGVKSGLYVYKDQNGRAQYSSSPQELKTDSTGKIVLTELWEGNYTLTEVSNPYSGYDSLPKVVKQDTLAVGSSYSYTIENEKKYINLIGTVWIEKPKSNGKEDYYNNVLGSEDNTATQGIKVYLVKNDGTRTETTTDNQGKYSFNNILIADIQNNRYHIEYVYNGMKYQSVVANTSSSEGKPSRASDVANSRNNLNVNFSTISSNNATNANNPNRITYSHNTQNYTSTVVYDENQTNKNAGREADYITQTTQSRYNVTASTSGVYNLSSGYDKNNLSQSSIEVNFGIIERTQPDLAVTKDVQNVKVSVKDETYDQLYTYGERVHSDNLSEKFSDNLSYSRNLYASDIAYGDADYGDIDGQSGKQLDVKVIYKIGLRNKTELNATIDRLNDFYSSEYGVEDITIGQINEQTGEFTATYNNEFTVTTNSGVRGYNKLEISRSFTIAPNRTEYFYIQFTVIREALKDLLNNGNVKEMKNFIEIEQYTTRDSNGNLYAGIDKNSQPGNMVPDNQTTYEDDNDKAPGLTIGLKAERELTGNVFLDVTGEETQQGAERKGNGIFDNGENLVNVEKVELCEVDSSGNISERPTQILVGNQFVRAEFTENTSTYDISGFVPGRYVLKYTWGNGETTYYEVNGERVIISSQRYKGTIFNQEKHQGEDWYIVEPDTRYSDAIDDYERRQEIDSQTSSMTNRTVENSKIADNSITSQTPTMNMNIEYGAIVTIEYAQERQLYVIENGKVQYDENGYAQIQDGQEVYTVKNIDFGIAERPRQELKLDKYVQHVTIYGTDGNRLVEAERNAEGVFENTMYFAYIPAGPGTESQAKVEMDKELMNNATIVITYNFKITNVGELDYSTEDYYKYGIVGNDSEIVRLKPNQIIDYVDNTIEAYETSNPNWTFYETNTDKQKLLNNSEDPNSLGLIATIEQLEKRNKVAVLSGIMADDNPGLKPGEELTQYKDGSTISLTSSKLLSVEEDGIEIINGAEIIEIIRTGDGSTLYESTPGNYDIEQYTTIEPDSSYSERTVIITPQGEDRNYTFYILIGVGVLAIIAIGVVLIKKKALK